MNLLKICLFLLAAAFFIAACSRTTPNTNVVKAPGNVTTPVSSQPAAPVDETVMAKELYATNCMICHKESGKGGKITLEGKTITPEDLTEDKFKKMPDEKLAGYVTNGVEDEGMPAFKEKLAPDQIKLVIRHVRTLQQ